MAFSKEIEVFLRQRKIAFLKKRGYSANEIFYLDTFRYSCDSLISLMEDSGNGREYLIGHPVVCTHERNDLIIDRIQLPNGLFRRIRRGNQVIRFQNLSESRKKPK